MSISEKRIFRSYGMITMGTFLMALGTCLIYEPMSMVTGGFSGVGIVLEKLFGIPVFAVTFLLNVPLFFYGEKIPHKGIFISFAVCHDYVLTGISGDSRYLRYASGLFDGGNTGWCISWWGAWTCVSCRKFHRRHGFVKYPFTSAVPNDAAGKYHRNCRWYNCCCRYAGFWCADGTVFHCGGFCDFESNGWSDIRNALCKNYVYHFRPVGRNCRNYSAPI